MTLYTIGFTQKSAADFFGLLRQSGAQRLVDVRLNNTSQLAGFAKRDDLAYFLEQLCGMEYLPLPQLAPTKEMLNAYRKGHKHWAIYESQFLELLATRGISSEPGLNRLLADAYLLCSEHKPDCCHRRLAAEYLARQWGNVRIEHLG